MKKSIIIEIMIIIDSREGEFAPITFSPFQIVRAFTFLLIFWFLQSSVEAKITETF